MKRGLVISFVLLTLVLSLSFASAGLFNPTGNTQVQTSKVENPEENLADTGKEIIHIKSLSLKEGQEDFEVQTFEQFIQTFLSIFGIVQGVVVISVHSSDSGELPLHLQLTVGLKSHSQYHYLLL